jgi:tRNA-dihydrouridine synthase A
MMDRTDRHFRYFLRRLTRHTLLYTEMVTSWAVLRGDRERLLGFDLEEKPLALQLGGDDPEALAACARIAADMGYDEVNLNVGCPSERVQKGSFGACLMAEPRIVADAVAAMRAAVALPITVKHRIGVDHLDTYEHLASFVATVAEAGCDRFSVHARIAWLSGLSPKENREVPPLRYADVYRLQRDFPHLTVEINGGVRSLDEAEAHLEHVAGVMIGRAAYDDPYLFADADRRFFGDASPPPSRRQVVEAMAPYLERWHRQGLPIGRVTRHMLQLFAGRPGARAWRRALSEGASGPDAGPELLLAALERMPEAPGADAPGYSDAQTSTSTSSPRTRTL